MSVITIKSTNVRTRENSEGTPYIQQQAAIDQGGDFPAAFWITVKKPYEPGTYVLDAKSFRVNQYERLELGYRLELRQVKAS